MAQLTLPVDYPGASFFRNQVYADRVVYVLTLGGFMRFARLAVLVLAAALAACSSDSTGSSSGGHGNSITVSNNSFNPNPDTAAAGVVTFTWSNASNGHNVTWTGGPTVPANSTTKTSGTYSATLSVGTYTYRCTIHSGMNGTIVVQ